MSEQHQLYINGAWIETEASVVNTSPSDTTDVIGHYAQASMPQVEAAITAAMPPYWSGEALLWRPVIAC